jgi:hypothetical protein
MESGQMTLEEAIELVAFQMDDAHERRKAESV